MIPTALLIAALLPAPASAQDDPEDWVFDGEEEEEEEEKEPVKSSDDDDMNWLDDEEDADIPDERLREEKEEDWFGGEDNEEDPGYFLDEEEEMEGELRAGQDNEAVYREFLMKVSGMEPEDELASWENYLIEYPFSVFEDRISARVDELSAEVYSERITGPGGPGSDALRQELDLAVPLLLESIDPRSKVRVGFEWGFPAYLNLLLDGEYQILRELSGHAGIRRRYTGWNLETGVKYAPIKSVRTGTVVSGLLDLHINTNPFFPAVRPQLGVGQVFKVGGGLHVQAQGGVDLEFWSEPGMQVRYVGGANIFYQAADNVGVFVETSTNMKHLGGDGDLGSFRFNLVTFGLRFSPGGAPARIGLSANVPYTSNYWAYHFGAIQGDVNYFL